MGIIQRIKSRLQGDEGPRPTVKNTGTAIETNGGKAVTGYSGPPLRRGQRVTVKNTGNAISTNGGTSVSGISYAE